MYRDVKVAVVVPAHNEERLIGQTISTMPGFVDRIIVVDDGSTDDTCKVAVSTGDARVDLLRLEKNGGVGAATVAGHRRALEGDYDVVALMDGDAQMDPDYLGPLLDPIVDGEAQFTKANRFFGPGTFSGMPRHRIVGNILLSFLTKAASGYWNLFDPQNGFTAMHRRALERLPLERLAAGYDYENDVLIQLNVLRVPARDVPVPARYGQETSGMRLTSVGPRILARLWRGFWYRMWWKYVLQSFSAVALFFFTGLAAVGVGLAFGLYAILDSLGPPAATPGTVLLSVAPMLTGVHLLIMAMWLDIQEGSA